MKFADELKYISWEVTQKFGGEEKKGRLVYAMLRDGPQKQV